MSDQLKKALRSVSDNGDELYAKVCRVLSVDGKLVSLKPVDGSAEIFDLPLQPDTSGKGLVIYPVVGSCVLVVFTDKHNAQVVGLSEIERYNLLVGTIELDVDATGISFKNGAESFRQIIDDLFSAIYAMSFTTPSGPTSPAPINIAQFQAVQQRFAQIFK